MTANLYKKQTETNIDFSAKFELFANERCLKNYSADLVRKITKGFSKASIPLKSPESILEFGAGIGALAIEFTAQKGIKPDCIEIDPIQAQIIKDRGLLCFNDINQLPKQYDAIYTSNVLEHIENDITSIKNLHDCLKPGGCIAIYVPAFMILWSQMDELVGHYRRYSRSELCQKTSAAGFHILSCHYVDSVGFMAWLYLRMKGYKKGDAVTSDKSLKFFDTILYPISRFLDFIGFRYLFGKNLLLVAVKPTHGGLQQ